jgi:predicted ribosome quality control (RQC) complex YloA/Tae2 family protein
LKGTIVSACFSQNRDELIIQFETSENPFLIRASLLPSFSCLSLPEQHNRARVNSADLFADLIGQQVTGVRQYRNERSFSIQFTNTYELLFKLHGNRSNILLFKGDVLHSVFKNNIKGDFAISAANLDREIDWSFENFGKQKGDLQKTYFTFGKVVWQYLAEKGFSAQTADTQWKQIQEVLQRLGDPTYHISKIDGRLVFSLLPVGTTIRVFNDPLKAINDFYISYMHFDTFEAEKSSAMTTLKQMLKSSENYKNNTTNKIRTQQTENNYKIWADILMANLHAVGSGIEKVILPNLYSEDQPIEIKLKRELNPQKNAEVFYTKAKKQQLEISRLEETLVQKQEEIGAITSTLKQVESATDLKTLRSLLKNFGIDKPTAKQSEVLPYHEFESNGYRIFVGKNAISNDKLTLKHSYKEDLWLHAKDVSGSHVLIKYQSGKKFPKDVVERAAQLAAYFSKRKKESLCPVIVTPKKFVRKRKGDPPGSVVVEREEVILVTPKQ